MSASRSILITGASRGIGRALAHEFSAHGSPVVLLARSVEAIRDIAREIRKSGGSAWYQRCDVTDGGQVRDAVEYARKCLGRIDVAILNAGVGQPEWIQEMRAERLAHTLDVNVVGVGRFLEHLVPVMKKQGAGVIAGVSSLADVRGFPGSGAYCASKAAVSALLESARVELRSSGIRVITVRPGFVRSDMTAKNEFPMPFLWSPEKAARAIRRGIEKGRRRVQFPWPIVYATRVITGMPSSLFDALASRSRRPGRSGP